jgi:hypothetical protein
LRVITIGRGNPIGIEETRELTTSMGQRKRRERGQTAAKNGDRFKRATNNNRLDP